MINRLKLKEYLKSDKIKYISVFIILGVFSWLLRTQESQAAANTDEMTAIDQLLGDGQIAAPIDLSNAEAIDGLMNQTAFVNLYTLHPQTLKANTKIATRIRLARSPKDPSKFFVIINESQLQKLLIKEGPYYAVLQSRHHKGPAEFNEKTNPKIQESFQSVGEL